MAIERNIFDTLRYAVALAFFAVFIVAAACGVISLVSTIMRVEREAPDEKAVQGDGAETPHRDG